MSMEALKHTFYHKFAPKGGEASGSELEDGYSVLDHRYNPDKGHFFLGESLRTDTAIKFNLAINDESHGVLVAGTRSGKGRAVIIPNILKHKGSGLYIDPKGEGAMACARALAEEHGYNVQVLDPFGICEKKIGHKLGYEAAWNPLADIDMHSDDAPAELNELAEILIQDKGAKETYWKNTIQIIAAGLLGFFMKNQIPNYDNIIGTADFAFQTHFVQKKLLEIMAQYPGDDQIAHMIRRGGVMGLELIEGDAAGRRSFKSLMATNFKWVDTTSIRLCLMACNPTFKMSDLKLKKKTAVFVVIPEYRIDSHGAWLSMLVNCAVNSISKVDYIPKIPVNLIIDEFGNLGELPAVRRAFAIGAGQGARIIVVLQSFGQLKTAYGDVWEDIIANASVVALSVRDVMTTKYLEALAGMTEKKGDDGKPTGDIVPVMSYDSISRFTQRKRGNGVFFPPGEGRVLFTLANYDQRHQAGIDYDVLPQFADESDHYELRRVKKGQRKRSKERPLDQIEQPHQPKLLTAGD